MHKVVLSFPHCVAPSGSFYQCGARGHHVLKQSGHPPMRKNGSFFSLWSLGVFLLSPPHWVFLQSTRDLLPGKDVFFVYGFLVVLWFRFARRSPPGLM